MTAFQPAGYTSVAPWVVTDDTAAILDFVADAFGGVELARATDGRESAPVRPE